MSMAPRPLIRRLRRHLLPQGEKDFLLLLVATSALAIAGAASAQTYGPPMAGVCVVSRDQALAASQAGVSANQQLTQFVSGVRGELNAQRSAIQNDDRALAAQKASLAAADYQQRVGQLRARYQALDHASQVRDAQLAATRKQAFDQIGAVMGPSLTEVIAARRCSLVLERASTYGANPEMDITAQVIQRMNARLPMLNLRPAGP